ncbi:MAG: hypothetical protein J2P39_04035 [Candidatus Dormibacteraeota bacterium]|nr:hypothetical protein [Candidatus Dormibacteraeota bacterium]
MGRCRLGVTFSARRAAEAGLEPLTALTELLSMELQPLRLCAYWDEVAAKGYGSLDRQLEAAGRAGVPTCLAIGMKSPGWPEFHLPDSVRPPLRRGADVARAAGLRGAVLEFLRVTVERYREHASIRWWQVENEPLNRSGPQAWWIGRSLLEAELACVQDADQRPIVLTCFSHFDRHTDVASGHRRLNLGALLGRGPGAEAETLALLRPGDVLGLDVYRRIGRPDGTVAEAAADWIRFASRWERRAHLLGIETWVTEAQAEPWEPHSGHHWTDDPRSQTPEDAPDLVRQLVDAEFRTILLWGAEYWLAQEQRGDRRWRERVTDLVAEYAA